MQVNSLLHQLCKWNIPALKKVIITINSPTLDIGCFDLSAPSECFDIRLVNNQRPLGFGANHNQAFALCDSEYFFVLNPDLDLICNPFDRLLEALVQEKIGCAYPMQISPTGLPLDFERPLTTPGSIIWRHLPSYNYQPQNVEPVHWVSGAFMAFKSPIFRELGGFDESYFMYCEDVDICLRLQLAGYKLASADAKVIHHTQRKTLKSVQHLVWHMRSLLRLWNSIPYKKYKQQFINNNAE